MKNSILNNQTIFAFIILITVFILDLYLPDGIAVGVLYLLCFLIIHRQNTQVITIFAILVIAFSLMENIHTLTSSFKYNVLFNRLISMFAILTAIIIAYKRRVLSEKNYGDRNKYIKELEEMLFIISHELRVPIANGIGLMNLIKEDETLTDKELRELIVHVESSINDLDNFTRKLSDFVYEIKQKNKMKMLEKEIF